MVKQKPSELRKSKLSIAIATFNEERSLANCLQSVKNVADEIVIVDGSSIDKTVDIAKSFGAKVVITQNEPIFHLNKQQAINECSGEWILQLDADEIISPELAKEIKSIVAPVTTITYNLSPITYDAYWIKRRKMFLGQWIKKGGQYPDPVIRLFKKGKAYLPCKSVHEQMKVDGTVGWLNTSMIHLSTPSFSSYITKDNRYSTLTSLELKEKKISINFISFFKYIIWEPNKIFFLIYFRHLGFLDGFPGFVFAIYSGLHQMSAYIKYWEMKNSSGVNEVNVAKDWI